MLGFVLGALAGGLAATYWSRGSMKFGERQLPRLRNQAADRVDAAERAIIGLVKSVSARTRASLRCDDVVSRDDAKAAPSSATILRQ
jgi:hypothetical protein